MDRKEILNGLTDILKTIRSVDPEKLNNITEDTDLIADASIPSTEMINTFAKAEQKFDVEFEDDDIDNLGSSKVKDIIDLIIATKEKQA